MTDYTHDIRIILRPDADLRDGFVDPRDDDWERLADERVESYLADAFAACHAQWPSAIVEIDRSQQYCSGATRPNEILRPSDEHDGYEHDASLEEVLHQVLMDVYHNICAS